MENEGQPSPQKKLLAKSRAAARSVPPHSCTTTEELAARAHGKQRFFPSPRSAGHAALSAAMHASVTFTVEACRVSSAARASYDAESWFERKSTSF
jgi:hypothetical protein